MREGWNGKGQYLGLQEPDKLSKMTLPYIYIVTVQGGRVPWLASQSDMLADDWCLVTGREPNKDPGDGIETHTCDRSDGACSCDDTDGEKVEA